MAKTIAKTKRYLAKTGNKFKISKVIDITSRAIFHLPIVCAGIIVPSFIAKALSTVTRNSLPIMIPASHESTLPRETKGSKADIMSNLSAIGSKIAPSGVI